MKRLLLASLILGISSPAHSSIDSAIHKMCIDARDYKGCINSQKNQKKDRFNPYFNKTKKQKKEFDSCLKASSSSRRFGDLPIALLKRACDLIVRTESNYVGKKSLQGYKVQNGYGICIFNSLSKSKLNEKQALDNCSCAMDLTLKYPYKQEHLPFCWTRAVDPIQSGGMRLFVKEGEQYSWNFGVRENTLKQAKIRESYGRYISFQGRSTNEYSGEYIPGERGYIDCDWGSSGSLYGDAYSIEGEYSSSGGCVGEDSTPSITIPGGVEVGVFKYLLDCKDNTFDRKGDRVSVSGFGMKGWQDVSSDSTASYVAQVYCPVISTLRQE